MELENFVAPFGDP